MAVCLSGLTGPVAFDTVGEPATLWQRWRIWKDEFELFVTASGIDDSKQQRALLLHLAGPGVREIFRTIPEETKGGAKDYKQAMDSLNDYFKLKKNIPKARQNFLGATPAPGERINNFVTRLSSLAEHCEYGDEKDNMTRDQVLTHIKDKQLKSKLYRSENLTLSKLLEVVSQYHDKDALILVQPAEQINRVELAEKQTTGISPMKFQGRCWNCNKLGHLAKDCRCSRDHVCESCGRQGHFAVCCHYPQQHANNTNRTTSHGRTPLQSRRGGGRNKVHAVTHKADGKESEDDAFYVFTASTGENLDTLELRINDKMINVIVDSGASCNLMSERVFDSIRGKKRLLARCDKNVYAYTHSQPLELKGSCMFRVTVPQTNMSTIAEFYIVPGHAATLLGRKTSEILAILKVGINVNNCSTSTDNVQPLDKKASLRVKFPKVFAGLGKLKGYQLKLHQDDSVPPVAQPLRRIPFSRRQKVTTKLKQLEDLDVIEKVNGPTSWINPLVAVEKPNGDIRICLDMRQANCAILREKHPVPTVEETLQEISEATVFSKLDLNMAFHQIELHPDSRDITTFAAPDGLYRYKRLLFGVNMATEKFQQLIWQILRDCPGAYNLHDDVRVVGRDHKEHDENLDKVMRKFEEHGLTLNYEKCVIGAKSMEYMGEVLTGEGLQVSKKRVEAIVDAPRPQNQSEMRSFLGSAQFCAKFIPGFSTVSSPLWDLTRTGKSWKWGIKEEEALEGIKKLLTNAPVMAYFTKDARTRLVTDASPVGLGAVLEQEQENGSYRPVYYASRKLNNVEKRYSQFEREALAVRWACQKFYLYLCGIEFELRTDHKPLVTVLGVKSTPPSARIERWLLYLQQFRYVVTHISGKENYADALSRLPVSPAQDCDAHESTEYACSIASEAVPAALTPHKVERASAKDPTLQLVREAVSSGDWSRLSGTMYKALSEDLWVLGQLVLRGNRIIMPECLWKHTIALAHEGHQGMIRTKARLRAKVWWPNMDKQVEQFVRACHPCQLVGPRSRTEPIRSTTLPEVPWGDIAVDLLEIPGGNHLLVVVDNYSRWPEAILIKKADASHVTRAMEGIFQTHGIPESLRSDNGPPFSSAEFEGFLDYLGIAHLKGIPYWPQSNGEVERCNETLLKIIRIATLEGKDWKTALQDFLFQYRTTPHTVSGLSPAELLMGRRLNNKLPRVNIPSERITEAHWQQLLRERDALGKLRQKEYADTKRAAQYSNIREGDRILLSKNRDNKLSPNFEPLPYKVVEKKGNAVLIQDEEGNTKLRNASHMKKFIQPDLSIEATEAHGRGEADDIPTENELETTVSTPPPSTDTHPTPPPESNASPLPSKSTRVRRPPAWMSDFVSS